MKFKLFLLILYVDGLRQYNRLMKLNRSRNGMQSGRWSQGVSSSTDNLSKLHKMLKKNGEIQHALLRTRDQIKERMQNIDQYISTYRLKEEHPSEKCINSLLKFEKNSPPAYKQLETLKATQNVKAFDDQDFFDRINERDNKWKGKKNYKSGRDLSKHPNNPTKIGFLEMSKKIGYPSGMHYFREWYEAKHPKFPKAMLTEEQQKLLVQLQKKYGNCWQKICRYMQNRFFDDVYYQFHNRINPKVQQGRWTFRQSLMLIILLDHYGTRKWAFIGEVIVVKSQLQCRERYCNILDPSLGRDHYWTEQMEQKLIEIAMQYNFSWFKIAKMPLFKNKTDNAIWRKFRSLIIKKEDHQIETLLPNDSRQLAKKVLAFKKEYNSKKRRFVVEQTKKVFDPNARAKEIRSSMSQRGQSWALSLSRSDFNSEDMSMTPFNVKKSLSEESVSMDIEAKRPEDVKQSTDMVFKVEDCDDYIQFSK